MIGNETANIGLAPDNDPTDFGVDIYANYANGIGPQADGPGYGVFFDIDTTSRNGVAVGADDSDSNIKSDIAVLGEEISTDDGYLAVHLSGTESNLIDGQGRTVDDTASSILGFESIVDALGLISIDDA
jgi:hypothetical protein